ncbi:ATP-binding protein [Amycolatopsis thermophila]|uniref:DNA-binding SARP family transcriptional activator/tetratricopeptide (TPR) repeat protein n=1 Tax=Amycolatopsis thermophila TaxID=206084 RepID=A0ABU0EWU1_9PSEU|nr:AAA family ATPase [Amycolatopsis thermophila]MDQ0379752.1 DNA-binding SARP family transcriptional activator/tetratricopeptide (TPR) repeat protein [Amycolatopsis thermophila]
MRQVSLLGEQAILDEADGVVVTRSPRSVALVAFLVVHAGVPQPRQRIAALFWPDSTEAQALTNLRRELHHLRHAIGGESLVATGKDLCWRDTPAVRVDVRDLELAHRAAITGGDDAVLAHAPAAIAGYRGEFLPGIADEWVVQPRAELESRCVRLCDLLCEARRGRGDLPGAAEVARRRIHLRPLEEHGYRTLMELQAAMGDRAGAVSTYHHCASILERELGVVPDEATRKVLRRLLARPSGGPRPGTAGLVGRSRELRHLLGIWQNAAAGRAGLVLVRGGAGVGKSRLLDEVAGTARAHGAVVATSQCFGTPGRLPLAPVADWLRAPAVQAATTNLDPVWRAEVDRLVPSGRSRDGPDTGTRAMVDAWQRHRFFEGLARALTGTGRPMLLVLDNLQWCDQETLAFLTFCLGLRPDAPVLVAATLRTDDFDEWSETGDWVARMRATGLLTEQALNPLEPGETARLAELLAGQPLAPGDRELLQATTGGFPLYVVEAVRGKALPGSDLTAVLRNRVEQAGSAARRVAGLAAAVGRDFTLALLTEASDLEPDTVVRAVDELWRRRIFHECGDGYDFSHELLRDTAYRLVSPPNRWLLHRRIAQALEMLHAGDTDPVSGRLAEQYARGGRPDRAVSFYRRAAAFASSTFAHAEAIRLHQEALDLVRAQPDSRESARAELSILETMAAPLNARYGYASPQVQHALERTIDLARQLGRRDSALTAMVGLWASRFVQGRTGEAYELATTVLNLVDPDSELRGAAHFTFGGSATSLGRPAEALQHFDLAVKLSGDAPLLTVGTRLDVHATAWAAHPHWLLGHTGEAVAAAVDAIGLARAIDHPYSLAVALAYAGITYQMCDEKVRLGDVVGELGELCDRYGFAYYREWGLVLGGWRAGRIDTARRGIDNLRAEGSFARMPYWLSLLADLSGPESARATLDAAIVAGQARDDVWWMPEVMRRRAALDEPATAVSRLRSAVRLATAQGSVALRRRCEHDLGVRGGVR